MCMIKYICMDNKIIIPTGYMGSGSSAITDILKEYKTIKTNEIDFEYVFLHTANGVFDLEYKLLSGNNTIRSDEAIRAFYSSMNELFDKKFYWPGNYKKYVSSQFLNYCNKFINEIIIGKYKDIYSYYQQKPNLRIKIIRCFNKIINIISFKKIKFKSPLLYKDMYLSFPSKKEYCKSAKKLVYSIAKDLGLEKHNIVMDQLLLPHNLYKLNDYFDNNVRVVVVERDPRDVYILNKYYWREKDVSIPLPIDVYEFCNVYQKMREAETCTKDSKILRIKFEDLIYKYDNSIKKIEKFIGLKKEEQILKYKYFNPNISKNNTQLFNNAKYKEEIEIIEKKLDKYLYKFPYKINIENNPF